MSGSGGRTLLAFDYGAKRIGVAVGDAVLGTASGIDTLDNGANPDWQALDALIEQWRPGRLIVGVPYTKDGRPGGLAAACKRFARSLSARYGLPADTVDERLTSRDAEARLRGARRTGMLGRRIRKKDVDKLAAQLILENWHARTDERGGASASPTDADD